MSVQKYASCGLWLGISFACSGQVFPAWGNFCLLRASISCLGQALPAHGELSLLRKASNAQGDSSILGQASLIEGEFLQLEGIFACSSHAIHAWDIRLLRASLSCLGQASPAQVNFFCLGQSMASSCQKRLYLRSKNLSSSYLLHLLLRACSSITVQICLPPTSSSCSGQWSLLWRALDAVADMRPLLRWCTRS